MVRISILLTILSIALGLLTSCDRVSQSSPPAASAIERAFENRERDVQVEGEGVVTRVLADDRSGSPHQRFIVRLASGQTVLIQHNIELAPRIEDLNEGDTVSFFGEYVWNTQGGIVHWTHHDPAGRHIAGWLKHKDRTYQ